MRAGDLHDLGGGGRGGGGVAVALSPLASLLHRGGLGLLCAFSSTPRLPLPSSLPRGLVSAGSVDDDDAARVVDVLVIAEFDCCVGHFVSRLWSMCVSFTHVRV